MYAPTAMKAPLPSEICPLTPVSRLRPARAMTYSAISPTRKSLYGLNWMVMRYRIPAPHRAKRPWRTNG